MTSTYITKKFSSINNIIRTRDFLKFQFNNSKLNTNTYSFDFLDNKVFLENNDILNVDKIEKIISGVDKKAEKIDSLTELSYDESVFKNKFDCEKKLQNYLNHNFSKAYGLNIKLNNHYNQTYVYSSKIVLNDISQKLKVDLETSKDLSSIISFYDLLTKLKNKEEIKNIDEVFNMIEIHIQFYLSELEKFEANQEIKKKLIETKCANLEDSRYNLFILGTVLWIALFFSLIYIYYGWDVIEPITYLSMNGMFIIQLLFILLVGVELSPNYLYSDHYRGKNMKKLMQKHGYCNRFHINISKEVKLTKVLLKALEGFRKVSKK